MCWYTQLSGSSHLPVVLYVIFIETGFHSVTLAALELTVQTCLVSDCLQNAGIKAMCHHSWWAKGAMFLKYLNY